MPETADAGPVALIAGYLRERDTAPAAVRIEALTPDASTRRYFRVHRPGRPTTVLAVHDGPIDFRTLPFANVATLLRLMDLPVPAILGHDDGRGIVELEDLGDVTLQSHLAGRPVRESEELYGQAVMLIVRLQERGRAHAQGGSLPYTLAFDVEKLTFELNFFVEHFLEGFRRAALQGAERRALAEEWSAIAEELSAEPRVLCHRDYHSRNLMVHDRRLYMIDFQDARMGPDTYDLASLLRDSYVDVADDERDRLIALFRREAGIPDAVEFRRRFDLMAVQRNLKALGTFGFQASARGNAAYVASMPRTLAYVRENLGRYERFARLRTLLATHVSELR